jgi:hypothetical protein
MVSENQIKIADFLLKYLYSVGGKSSKDDYPEKLNEQGFNKLDWHATIQILIEYYGLIDYVGNSDNWIMLTPEGNKVAKNGINKFLDEINKEKQLRTKQKKATISSAKISKGSLIISIIAIVMSSYQFFTNTLKENIGYNRSDTHNKSNNRQPSTKPCNSFDVRDSLYIEEVKNSLKHDIVFLNEVKQLIDKEK